MLREIENCGPVLGLIWMKNGPADCHSVDLMCLKINETEHPRLVESSHSVEIILI